MAEAQRDKILTLSEQYVLKDKEEKIMDMNSKPVEVKEVDISVISPSDEIICEKAEGTPVTSTADEHVQETGPTPAFEESGEVISASESSDKAIEMNSDVEDESGASTEESGESNGEENTEETSEIQLETAPVDFRFPTTNQTRHCFTRYIEYHRCVAAKGEGAPECDKFAKYYRALCPGEWVERWNEQRENGTFPGPL